MIGIFINDLHSWQDFHLGLLERSLSALEKDDHTRTSALLQYCIRL